MRCAPAAAVLAAGPARALAEPAFSGRCAPTIDGIGRRIGGEPA